MDFYSDKSNTNRSLEDLRQKLTVLNILMRRSAMNGNLKELDKSPMEK